ncbi:protein disulfide oxidoreductase [Methylococcus sp. EFPC2]|uniref:protein disulfide oxidoreductase n=1 Tax=Methylococcus sp. EFPC2 TaxID=2812648 RepID=UPI0019670C52|nr:protein disulfide oxidoreductase [Methylococcus sp. EFPC2]QSA97041.1 protein disulfide oxidoreductase [Methylococcus sp. EFPC2]
MNFIRRHWFWPVLLAAFLAAQLWANRELVTGEAPAIHAADLQGRPFDLAQLRGRPALVYFWGSWCSICRAMQSTIQAVASDFPVITVALRSGGADAVTRYQNEQDFHPPTVLDEGGKISEAYGLRGVPAALILGPDGVIRYAAMGYTSEIGLRFRLWLAGL